MRQPPWPALPRLLHSPAARPATEGGVRASLWSQHNRIHQIATNHFLAQRSAKSIPHPVPAAWQPSHYSDHLSPPESLCPARDKSPARQLRVSPNVDHKPPPLKEWPGIDRTVRSTVPNVAFQNRSPSLPQHYETSFRWQRDPHANASWSKQGLTMPRSAQEQESPETAVSSHRGLESAAHLPKPTSAQSPTQPEFHACARTQPIGQS